MQHEVMVTTLKSLKLFGMAQAVDAAILAVAGAVYSGFTSNSSFILFSEYSDKAPFRGFFIVRVGFLAG